MQLPEPIELYFRAENQGDVELLDACFLPNATVRDEGHTYEGLTAIKAWKAQTKQKYSHTVEPLHVSEREGRTLVTARVSGNFPGSPISLDFSFFIEHNKIRFLVTL